MTTKGTIKALDKQELKSINGGFLGGNDNSFMLLLFVLLLTRQNNGTPQFPNNPEDGNQTNIGGLLCEFFSELGVWVCDDNEEPQ